MEFENRVKNYLSVWETGERKIDKNKRTEVLNMVSKATNTSRNIFGESFFTIHDFSSAEVIYVSPECLEVTGYPEKFYYEGGMNNFMNLTIREHFHEMMPLIRTCWEHTHTLPPEHRIGVTANFDFVNIHGKTNKPIRVLNQQIVAALDIDFKIWICIGIFSNINHLKPPDITLKPSASLYVGKTRQQLVINTRKNKMVDLNELSKRETQILKAYGSGMKSNEIAEKFNISQLTVQTHRTNVYKKLGIRKLESLKSFAQTHLYTPSDNL